MKDDKERLALCAAAYIRNNLGPEHVTGCLKDPEHISNYFSTTSLPIELSGACNALYDFTRYDPHTERAVRVSNEACLGK